MLSHLDREIRSSANQFPSAGEAENFLLSYFNPGQPQGTAAGVPAARGQNAPGAVQPPSDVAPSLSPRTIQIGEMCKRGMMYREIHNETGLGVRAISYRKARYEQRYGPIAPPLRNFSRTTLWQSKKANEDKHGGRGMSALPMSVEEAAQFMELRGNWNHDFGDIAPLAIANTLQRRILILNHPANRQGLLVRPQHDSNPASPPITIHYIEILDESGRLVGDHYETYVGGRRHDVLGDGDCLFRAVLMNVLQCSSIPIDTITDLRRAAARVMRNNRNDYAGFLRR